MGWLPLMPGSEALLGDYSIFDVMSSFVVKLHYNRIRLNVQPSIRASCEMRQ